MKKTLNFVFSFQKELPFSGTYHDIKYCDQDYYEEIKQINFLDLIDYIVGTKGINDIQDQTKADYDFKQCF